MEEEKIVRGGYKKTQVPKTSHRIGSRNSQRTENMNLKTATQ
jgi:hypothetical protein